MEKRLLIDLTNRMRTAKLLAKDNKRREAEIAKRQAFTQPNTNSVKSAMSDYEYFQIVELFEYMRKNRELSDEQVREILSSKFRFNFLRKLDRAIPDMIGELREHGPRVIAYEYARTKEGMRRSRIISKNLP